MGLPPVDSCSRQRSRRFRPLRPLSTVRSPHDCCSTFLNTGSTSNTTSSDAITASPKSPPSTNIVDSKRDCRSSGRGFRWDGDDKDGETPIIVRGAWDQITPRSCRWCQAVSRDDGKTWEDSWVMHWTRV